MDSTSRNKGGSRLAKTFQKVISLNSKSSGKNRSNHHGFCLMIPQEKLRCCESQQFEKEHVEEVKEEHRSRASMEAFVAKVFATVSAVKAAYAELQIAQFPYNNDAVQSADQAVVDELKALSELKHKFLKKQIDSSPPHVTIMLAEIQEQQALMKAYEITMKKMQAEIEGKDSRIASLGQNLREAAQLNKSLEKKLNASGCFSVVDNVGFSEASPKDFVLVLQYCMRSVKSFVKLMIHEMESANWDIEAASKAIQPDAIFAGKKDHRAFAFESYVCRQMFSGFNEPGFCLHDASLPPKEDARQRRTFFFEQFKKLRSASASHATHRLKQNPNSLFAKFLKSKYLQLVHPKTEFSFSGNLNQRKMVNSGEWPETEMFKSFAEMCRRVWLLHCLAFSFECGVSVFQVKKGCRFSEVYMESVADDVLAAEDGELRAAFTVVPGFKVGHTVVQCQVYLSQVSSK